MVKEVYEQKIEKCGKNIVKLYYDVFTGNLLRIIVNNKIVCDHKIIVDKEK